MYSFDLFFSYLKLGFGHIVDFNGFDHILFIITLCAVYQISEWKRITIVVTAFTLGHSLTLALASLKIILPDQFLIELLIPFTILFSGLFNLLFLKYDWKTTRQWGKYILALFFGLIHGMSFSGYFTYIMGDASKILFPLFSFNLGIEFGQLFVIFLYYLFVIILVRGLRINYKYSAWFFSILGIVVSIVLIVIRIQK